MNSYETSRLTEQEKKRILLIKGFELEEGYCMDYEKPDEEFCSSVFISKEEWIKKTLEGCKEYWWNGDVAETMLDFDEAWTYAEEELWDEFDCNTFEEFDKKCLELINQSKELIE